jgi:uncharacterized phage protein gp47/JayE
VLAKTLAAVFITLYKYGGFIFLQIFVKTATISDTEINGAIVSPLKAWGELVGIGEPTAATNAQLIVDVTVTNQVGTLNSGTQLIGTTNGVTYITVGAVLLNAPVVQVTIKAVQDEQQQGGAGVIGNLDAGQVVSFANPIDNVLRDTTVDSQVVTAADQEGTEIYRQRILDRFQKRPQGGAPADYELWGEEAAGIVNVYVYKSGACPGQVDLYSEATVASSGSPDGIPTGAQLQAVLDSVNLDVSGRATRRQVSALAISLAITRAGFDVEVTGISGVDDLGTVQTGITEALTEFFLSREPFIPGLSVLPRRDRITSTSVAGVVEDIVNAAGGIFTKSELFLAGGTTPQTQSILAEGEKAKVVLVSFL